MLNYMLMFDVCIYLYHNYIFLSQFIFHSHDLWHYTHSVNRTIAQVCNVKRSCSVGTIHACLILQRGREREWDTTPLQAFDLGAQLSQVSAIFLLVHSNNKFKYTARFLLHISVEIFYSGVYI